jgi:hypothetical protein
MKEETRLAFYCLSTSQGEKWQQSLTAEEILEAEKSSSAAFAFWKRHLHIFTNLDPDYIAGIRDDAVAELMAVVKRVNYTLFEDAIESAPAGVVLH